MKTSLKKAIFGALAAGTALVTIAGTASAGGFSVREQSAEGQGASFAGIAAGGSDLSSIFFNPATITLHEGTQVEGDAGLILPYAKAKNGVPIGAAGGPNSGNIGEFAVVPATYVSHQIDENLFVGFTANSPFGLVTEGRSAWAGSFHGVESELFMIQAGPVVGYKINDMFSVAAAIRGVYADVRLTQNAGAGGVGKLDGDDWGVNYSVGVLINPTKSTRIGIGFNSQTKLKAIGELSLSLGPTQPTSAKLTTPGTLTVGLRQKVSEKVTLLLGFEWADWSKLKRLAPINTTTGAPATGATAFNWKDSYFYSVGGEYMYSEYTTFRAGFAFEDSPVPNSTRGVRVPDADRYWLSVGASHMLNKKFKTSVGFTHIIMDNGKVNLAPGGGLPGLTATFKQHVNILAVSGTYKF